MAFSFLAMSEKVQKYDIHILFKGYEKNYTFQYDAQKQNMHEFNFYLFAYMPSIFGWYTIMNECKFWQMEVK